jgi:hypothetical protein
MSARGCAYRDHEPLIKAEMNASFVEKEAYIAEVAARHQLLFGTLHTSW